MTMQPLSEHELQQALAAVDADGVSVGDQVTMLVEIAMRMQQQPKEPGELEAAITLYDRALSLLPDVAEDIERARIRARRATAVMQMPIDLDTSKAVIAELEAAREVLAIKGSPEESAECDMNLGLALQSGGAPGAVPLSIQAYQRALKVFTREAYPREYAILHSNLATAYLATPVIGSAGKMREALAVQSFEAALQAISINDHPGEYAMLQNNLGNALQYAASGHPLENNLRALQAYEEALKVRNIRDTPIEFANTLANMGNCISNLPDDNEKPDAGNPRNLQRAIECYNQAQALFAKHGEADKARLIDQVLEDLEQEAVACG